MTKKPAKNAKPTISQLSIIELPGHAAEVDKLPAQTEFVPGAHMRLEVLKGMELESGWAEFASGQRPEEIFCDKGALGFNVSATGAYDTERLARLLSQMFDEGGEDDRKGGSGRAGVRLSTFLGALKGREMALARIFAPAKRNEMMISPNQPLISSISLATAIEQAVPQAATCPQLRELLLEIHMHALSDLNIVWRGPEIAVPTYRRKLFMTTHQELLTDLRVTHIMGVLEKHRASIPLKFKVKTALGVLVAAMNEALKDLVFELERLDEPEIRLQTTLRLMVDLIDSPEEVPLSLATTLRPLLSNYSLTRIALSQRSAVNAKPLEAWMWREAVEETVRLLTKSVRYRPESFMSVASWYSHIVLRDDLNSPRVLVVAPAVDPNPQIQATSYCDHDGRGTLFTQHPSRVMEQGLEAVIKPIAQAMGHASLMEHIVTTLERVVPYMDDFRVVRLGPSDEELEIIAAGAAMLRKKDDPTADVVYHYNKELGEVALAYRLSVTGINCDFLSDRLMAGTFFTRNPLEVLALCESRMGKVAYPIRDQGIPNDYRNHILNIPPGHIGRKLDRQFKLTITGAQDKVYTAELRIAQLVGGPSTLTTHMTAPLGLRFALAQFMAAQVAAMHLAEDTDALSNADMLKRQLQERALKVLKEIFDKYTTSPSGVALDHAIYYAILQNKTLNPTIEDRDAFRVTYIEHSIRTGAAILTPARLLHMTGAMHADDVKLLDEWLANTDFRRSTRPATFNLS